MRVISPVHFSCQRNKGCRKKKTTQRSKILSAEHYEYTMKRVQTTREIEKWNSPARKYSRLYNQKIESTCSRLNLLRIYPVTNSRLFFNI